LTGVTQGKSNLFPLFENSRQAKSEAELDSEQPILLDPCKATDPGLLDFLIDGTPCPRFPDNPIFVRRVEESIRIYHLNHSGLVEQRRLLALKLANLILSAHSLYPKVLKGDQSIMRAFEGLVGSIAQSLDDRAELSAFARRIVAGHRDKPWIEGILDT
jgi:hypothetical protein